MQVRGMQRMVQRQCISALRMPQGATSETRMEVLKIRSLAGAVELGRNSLPLCAARMKDEAEGKSTVEKIRDVDFDVDNVGNNRIDKFFVNCK